MARFYVGQRVRVRWSRMHQEIVGEVGTIERVGIPDEEKGIPGFDHEYVVAMDMWGGTSKTPLGGIFAPSGDQLEPATDSYDKTEWKDCLWQPEHMRETA